MIVFNRPIAILIPIALLASCQTAKKTSQSRHRLMDTITVSARNNPMDIYRASSPKIWEIPHTDVKLRFDLEKKEAQGTATLKVIPVAGAADTLVLDAKSMAIDKVEVMAATGSRRPLPFSYDNKQLKISVRGLDFGSLAMPKAQTIDIEYKAMPYAGGAGGSAAITEERGLYFINTDHAIPGKPVQIWTQGETESNSHWLPTIDKPNQRTTFDLWLLVPDTMQTLSNGTLVAQKSLDAGMREDHWHMEQSVQMYAIMFAVGHFAIAKDSWKAPQGMLRDVHYYTEPAYGPYAQAMFKNTPEMMDFFSRTTGVPYPWNKYNQVVVRDYVSGAMENTTATLFGEWMNQDSRQLLDASTDDVIAHELFHQWFGDYVTAESWSNLTLNESFATYGTQLWRRYKNGPASAEEQAFEDLQRYLGAAEQADPPLVRYYYRDKEDMFDRISYQKGASILHYINSITGDSLFNRAMEIYLKRNALNSAEAAQWRQALEEATGRDWTQFFNQWYYRGGHPELRIRYTYDDAAGRLKVNVRQIPSPDSTVKYTLPLKTAIVYGDKRRVEEWTISERSHSYSYPYEGGVRPLIIPDVVHALPGVILEDKTPVEWLRQLKASGDYGSKRRAIAGAVAAPKDQRSLEILQAGLADSLAGIRVYTLNQLSRISNQAWRDALQPKVGYLLQTEGSNRVRAAAMSVAGSWKMKSELPAIQAAISDSSYYVSGAALHALRQIAEDSAYIIAKRLQPTGPKGYLSDAVWTAIVTKGSPTDIVAFEAKALHVYGAEKAGFAGNLRRYAEAVKADSLYERTLRLLVKLTNNENIRMYRYAIGSTVFELKEAYRIEAEGRGREAVRAKERLRLTERYTGQILEAEKEEANLKLYKEIGE